MNQRDTVLVIDDFPTSLSLLTDALEEAGFLVLVAQEGAKALTLTERITPDIILMDAMMPEMDGFETCRRLKQRPGLTHVPVIFMTGLSETEHVVQGFQAGGIDYVTKPIEPLELIARVRAHLASARMTLSARAALDATGRFLFAANAAGAMLWSTPQALGLLGVPDAAADQPGARLDPTVIAWLARAAAGQGGDGAPLRPDQGLASPQVSFVGRIGADEFLLRLTEGKGMTDEERLRRDLGLTEREAEVLLWIAHGKANRDVAAILDLSPRTVNKHLEQIFSKLGVENRTMAAARAMRLLTAH